MSSSQKRKSPSSSTGTTTNDPLQSPPAISSTITTGTIDKKSKVKIPAHAGAHLNSRDSRNALGNYIAHPERFPSTVVLYYDEHWVALADAFPKGVVHTLLLPRDPARAAQHPLEALQDETFLAQVRAEVPRLKRLVASELRRRLGGFSRAEKGRREAMMRDDGDGGGDVGEDAGEGEEGGDEEKSKGKAGKEVEEGQSDSKAKEKEAGDSLPPGRDWEAELRVGIHAGPSMNHLHIHVLSREYMGPNGRTGRHYQTFNTPFFVSLDDFPLDPDDGRFGTLRDYLARDLRCWRCDKGFGRSWVGLEAHLQEEFEEWKRE